MGQKQQAASTGTDRRKLLKILIPAAAVAGLLVLVAVIMAFSGFGPKMSDGSNGSIDDPKLQDIAPGVKYRDIKVGEGEPCTPGATVSVKYRGWLPDGTEFDSSKGMAVSMPLSEMVKGWQEGIPGMMPGGIRKLVIWPEKGYGSQQKGKVPPNSVMIFEVELVSAHPGPNDGPGRPMSDGSDGSLKDPALKAIGQEGLKYRDLKVGDGPEVPPGATVTVHYTGWLANGNVFDSSRKPPGNPITFPLNRVVRGWQEGIPGMKVGGIRKLVIPAELGYGEQGSGEIPPNATLIFEIELLRFN